MNGRVLLAALALAAALALPAAARAQVQPANEPGRTPGWTFTPTLGVSSGWDDNVGVVGTGEAATSDVVAGVSPSIDGAYLARRHWFGFAYRGSFQLYRQLNDLNSYDQRVRLDSRHTLSKRVSLTLHESFAATPTTDALMLSGVPFRRTGSRLNESGGALHAILSPRTTLSAGYNFMWVHFDRSSFASPLLQGGHSHGFHGSYSRRASARLTLGAEGSWRRSDIGDFGGLIHGIDAVGTVAFQPTRTLTLSGALGISRVTDADRLARTGPAVRVMAVQSLARATLTGGYNKSFVPAFGLGGSVQNEELSASLLMPVARNRLYWQAGISYRRHEPLLDEELRLESVWIHTSVGYSLHRLVRVEAFFARSQQDSLRPGGQVHRNRIGVQLVTSKPMRIK